MLKNLLLLFSFALAFTGCAQNVPDFAERTKYPDIVYPRYDTGTPFKIKAKRSGDEIIVSDTQFKGVTKKLVDMKYQIIVLQSILDDYNSWAGQQNEKKKKGFFR